MDPLTRKELNVSVTVYADDVKEINMASTAEEAIDTIQTSTDILNQGLVALTFKQNEDKAEHAPSFLGNGREKFTKPFVTEVAELKIGTSRSVAKYVGNFFDDKANGHGELI